MLVRISYENSGDPSVKVLTGNPVIGEWSKWLISYIADGFLSKMQRDKVEDTVLKALGHGERRVILRIIESNKDGLRYSDILSETGLTTSKLNYQLRELDGFIGKDEQLYRLTTLGRKAVGVLDYMGEDLESIDLGPSVDGERRRYVKRVLDKVFFLTIILIGFGALSSLYLYMYEPSTAFSGPILMLIMASCGLFIFGLDRIRRRSLDYVISFAEWLDWKFFNWRGSDEFRGRKTFILTSMGLVLGILLGNAGAGLLIGMFLGAVIEI